MGWVWRKLGEVCEKPEYGYTTRAKPDGEGPLFLRTTDISNGKIRWKSVPFCAEPPTDEECYSLEDGDILIARAGSVGASVVIRNPPRSIFASYLIRFRPREELDPSYAGFFLKSDMYWAQLGSKTAGTTLPGVNATNLAKVKIPLPPLPTQRRIVSLLEKAEETTRLRVQADELTDRLLQSVFLEMFGDPVKNPKGWETKTMNELCERITDGEHVTPQRTDEGIYLLSARNIQNHKIALDDVDFIGEEEYERISKRIRPQKGDILISCSGTIGRVTRVKENFKFQLVRSVALVRPRVSYVHPIYLEYVFDTNLMKNQIEKAVNQSSQANLFQGKIRKLSLLLPPLPLQQKFSRIVEKVEAMRQSQAQSKQQIEDLFSALMQKAFRGEI